VADEDLIMYSTYTERIILKPISVDSGRNQELNVSIPLR